MIERYYEQQRQNWLHVGSMGVYMAVARALDSLASTYTHVLVQEEKGALDSIASPAGRPTPSATPPDREEEGSGKTARQPHQKDSTISDVGPRGSRHRNNTRGSQRSSRAGVSRHHCTGALGQQCLFHDVCLTESDDTLRLTYFTPSFPPGNGDAVNGDAGGCPGPGGDISKLRIPLGGRPDDCGYMEIDAVEVHKHGPRADDGGTDGELLDVRFDDTNTVLIESTVPENAGHTLGEDVFCAFDMLALADAMLPEIVRGSPLLRPSTRVLLHVPGDKHDSRALVGAGTRGGGESNASTLSPRERSFRKFQTQFTAVSTMEVQSASRRVVEGGGRACFHRLVVGPGWCSYAAHQFQGALVGLRVP